jgi:hypothetical protein
MQDQGIREIVALASLNAVRRKLIDSLGRPQSTVSGAPTPPDLHFKEAKQEGLSVVSPLASIATGAAVAFFGIEKEILTTVGAAAAGLLASASTYLFLRAATAPPSPHTLLSSVQVPSLNRCLMYLVERILDAGLLPIFVVDELDKVPDLEDRMAELISSRKSLIAERAFFCFLTDRTYFEYIESAIRRSSNAHESTFFDQRTVVYYEPGELIKFLERTVTIDTDEVGEEGQAPGEERNHWEPKLIYRLLILLSRCQPSQLNGVIDAHRDSEGRLQKPGTDSAALGYRLAILMQVAVEVTFYSSTASRRRRLHPAFALMILDILYYPVVDWTTEMREASRLDTSLATVNIYLADRVGASGVSDQDVSFLVGLLKHLLLYLQSPETLIDAVEHSTQESIQEIKREFTKFMLNTEGARLALLESAPAEAGSDLYRWRYNQYGEPLTPLAKLEMAAVRLKSSGEAHASDLQHLADWLIALEDSVREIGGGDYGLVRLLDGIESPIRLEVRQCVQLASAARSDEDALARLKACHKTLLADSELLRFALLYAVLASSNAKQAETIAEAVTELREEPWFLNVLIAMPRDSDYGRIRALAREILNSYPNLKTLFEEIQRANPRNYDAWLQRLRDFTVYLSSPA